MKTILFRRLMQVILVVLMVISFLPGSAQTLRLDVRDGNMGVNSSYPFFFLRPTGPFDLGGIVFREPGAGLPSDGTTYASILYEYDQRDLMLRNSSLYQIVLENNGYVGINTQSAARMLDVQGFTQNLDNIFRAQSNYQGSFDVVAVEGTSIPNAYFGIGGLFLGGFRGVAGIVPESVETNLGEFTTAVFGKNEDQGDGKKYGVVGEVIEMGTGDRYGVYGAAPTQLTNSWAGFFDGDFYYTGDFQAPSDARLKKDIRDLEGALEKVMRLSPKTYQFRHSEYDYIQLAHGPQIGFLSQDVEKVLPDLVEAADLSFSALDDKTSEPKQVEIKSLNYLQLIPVVTGAIQEQQQIIDDQSAQIRSLQNQVVALQNDMRDLLKWIERQEQETITLTSARLDQNEPNPFDGHTRITWFIPRHIRQAELRITDARGVLVRSIQIDDRGAGTTLLQTTTLAAGTYLYTLVLEGDVVETRKMVVARRH